MSSSSFGFSSYARPIVVFGRDGQVGKEFQIYLGGLNASVVFLGRSDCDLSSELSITETLNKYQPQVIINAAAYTAVDKAETQPELAFAINAKAPTLMARYIANVPYGILVHYSTDYVFGDNKQSAYFETDTAGPVEKLSVYGQSKLAGEQGIEEVFNSAKNYWDSIHQEQLSRYFILRTSWVFGEGGNFIRTMLRLAAERDQLNVVADQVGVPTSAQWLAEVGMQMARSHAESGIYHAVPDGETSWHDLAVFAIETAATCGEGIEFKPENIHPITAVEYPLPAKRPYNSRLNNKKLKNALSRIAFTGQYPHWRDQVERYVREHVEQSLKS